MIFAILLLRKAKVFAKSESENFSFQLYFALMKRRKGIIKGNARGKILQMMQTSKTFIEKKQQ
jgi:hypothetical protein